jgi:hypothetical protein
MHLFRFQLPQLARLLIQHQRPIAHAPDLLHMVANLLEHLAQFAVAPLDQHHLVPGIVALAHLPDLRRSRPHPPGMRPRPAALDHHALAQRIQHLFRGLPGYLDQICFFDTRSSLGQLVGQLTVIGH